MPSGQADGHALRQDPPIHLVLTAVELPSPAYGYPTLDVLGCLASASCKRASKPSDIAKNLQERCRVETGIIFDLEVLMQPLKSLSSEEDGFETPLKSVPQPVQTSVRVDVTQESDHFQERIAQPDRPNPEQAYTTADVGDTLEERNQGGSRVRSTKTKIFSEKEHDEQLGRTFTHPTAVRVVCDEWTTEQGCRIREMITSYKKVRMQLVLIAPQRIVKDILRYRDILQRTMRCPEAKNPKSKKYFHGVCQLTALDDIDVESCPSDSATNSDDEARWAAAHVDEETKDYSKRQPEGIGRCGMNPDFKRHYLGTFRDKLLRTLRGAHNPTDALPSLHWSLEGHGGMPVVFLTVHLPEMLDMRLLPSAVGTNLQVLSVALSADRHPAADLLSRKPSTAFPSNPQPACSIQADFARIDLGAASSVAAKTLWCQDCRESFEFTSREQQKFLHNGWAEPIRCGPCRIARKTHKTGSGVSSG